MKLHEEVGSESKRKSLHVLSTGKRKGLLQDVSRTNNNNNYNNRGWGWGGGGACMLEYYPKKEKN